MSSLPETHEFYDASNKKEIGKWSLEYGAFIKKAILLKPKTYVVVLDDDRESKKGKGTPRAQLKNEINFEHYWQALFGYQNTTLNFNRIAHRRGEMLTVEREQKILDWYYDKRFLLEGIETSSYAHGHQRIRDQQS
jgi:hypothetical protein